MKDPQSFGSINSSKCGRTYFKPIIMSYEIMACDKKLPEKICAIFVKLLENMRLKLVLHL